MSHLDKIKAHASRIAEERGIKVELSSFLGGYSGDECVLVCPLLVKDIDEATAAAVSHRKGVIAELGDRARELLDDPALFQDAEAVEKVWRACRNADDSSERAFPSPAFIRESMTVDEVAALYAALETVQRAGAPSMRMTGEDEREFMLSVAEAQGERAELLLATMPRWALAEALAGACRRWLASEIEADVLRSQIGQRDAVPAD